MSIDESLATDPFGRFLIKQSNEWREIGVQAERERIIKLLEDLLNDPAQVNLAGVIIKIKEGNE